MKFPHLSLVALLACPLAAKEWKNEHPPHVVPVPAFKVPDGLEVTVWASTPDLYNPTNMDIDAEGRIWVAEGVNYRGHKGRRPGGDRIAVLQDTDGDGKADRSHTFVQEKGLIAPLGVAVFDNVVVVSQPPDLIVYTDVDRDLKFNPGVDKREVLLTGFNARNHDHSLHSVTGGPDGKWYFNNGNCGAIFTDKSGKTFTLYGDYRGGGGEWFTDSHSELGKASDDGFKWTSGFSARMNPDGTEVEIIGHGYRNSYEHAVNSLGELFQNDNDDPPACRNSYVLEYGSAGYFTRAGRSYRTVMRPGVEFGLNHWRQLDPGTFDVGDIYGGGSPTGVVYYENGALGDKYAGTFLSCEAGRNVIFAYQPEMQGAGYRMERSDWMTSNDTGVYDGADFTGGVRKQKLSRSGDHAAGNHHLFRPSDVAVGADGAIYVTDWLDPRVGGHADLDKSCSGTIYRIAPKGFIPKLPEIDLNTIEGAITALRSPAPNVRWTGFAALKKQGAKAYPAVEALIADDNPWIAVRGIWLLPYLGEKGLAKCHELTQSQEVKTRMVAFRALKRSGQEVHEVAKTFAADPSAAIRREAALAMRGLPASKAAPVLIEVAKRWDGEDKNYLESIGLGCENQENEVWAAMRDAFGMSDLLKWDDRFARLTWRLWPSAAIAALKQRATAKDLTQEQRLFACESIAFIDDPAAPEAMLELAKEESPVRASAVRWLLLRSTDSWAKYDLRKGLKERGVYDPETVVVNEMVIPPKPDKPKFSVAEVMELKGDAAAGKAKAMRCVMCHQIDGVGPDYGPDLKGWTARQGVESTILAIVDPSAGIAHGYSGRRVQLKDGKRVDGVIVANSDPLIVQSTGGVTQMIPKDRVKGAPPLRQSLMLSADQLGMSAQDVADVVEWMKGY
ncbi:MAG: dehydrogenase [Akkermansiaceae bacterium]|nr:dehydrogenase [Akkermansiaceae bacterium]